MDEYTREMSRLIDANALDKFLDAAEKEATKNRKYVLASAINTIRGNIRNFPSAQSERKWIPCSERLPEKNGRYLTTRGLSVAGGSFKGRGGEDERFD